MDQEQQGSAMPADQGGAATAPRAPFGKALLEWGVVAFSFILPFFVIPSQSIFPEASKAWVIAIVALVGSLILIARLLMRGSISIPRHPVTYSIAGVLLSLLLSTVFSPDRLSSFLGNGSQFGAAAVAGLFVLLFFIAAGTLESRKTLFRMVMALFASFGLIALFHIGRFVFGEGFLSFGVFQNPVFSPIGKWNDLAVFSGLLAILATLSIHSFRGNKLVSWIAVAAAVVSGYFVLIIDFWILWLVIALVMAVIAWKTGWQRTDTGTSAFSGKNVSYTALVFLVLGLCFGFLFRFPMGDSTLSQKIVSKLTSEPYAEIVLPPAPTVEIATDTWKEGALRAVFGSGPNRFSSSYFLHKPEGINQTPLWDSSFDSGFSHLLTLPTTTGILGSLAWLALLLSVALGLFRIFRDSRDSVSSYLGTALGASALYLWLVMGIYLPNLAIIALTFLFTGAMFAFLVHLGAVRAFTISLPSMRGMGVALVPLVALIGIGILGWGYFLTGALRADDHYQAARNLANQGNIRGAIEEATKADMIMKRDVHHRLLTDLQLLELQRVLGEAPSSADELRRRVQELTEGAIVSANRAIELDQTNYLNYVGKANIADLLATINVERTTTAPIARDSYIEALRRNPKSPRLEFAIGRIELLLENREGAILHLENARTLRPAYPEAIAALGELNRQNGNIEKAIEIATAGLQSDPNNFVISFQLGFLYYTNGDYDRAIAALERAVAINPYYADAKYFLGVSYARKGDKEKALQQFQEIRTLNPGNEEIERVIRNINAGRDPLADE